MDFSADDNAYFHADKHISTEKEDDFNRYPFAARLAGLIASHQSSYGLVISIYGEWGEGKSSFLDFIQVATEQLAIQKPEQFKTTIIKFNPWRFSTEDQLLMSFFSELWAALCTDRTVDKDDKLIRDKIYKYAQILGARKSASIINEEITNEEMARFEALGSLETLKTDINNILKRTGRKLLIIIDDSDRLNNDEVENTLRLVKLTADFSNTTYLIGLNHKMVAEAIGQRYPGSTTQAGAQFLEKIVQVPLYLPPIQPTQLRRYLQARLDEVFSRTGALNRLPDQEKLRCFNALEESVLVLKPNPRSIYRLANVLLVAIPLLEEEANLTDIILIESLRIFYPAVYELVRNNESIFTGPSNFMGGEYERKKTNEILGDNGGIAGKSLSLLANLFPKIDTIYFDTIYNLNSRRTRSQEELNYTRSIASDYYFKRYFYYALQEGIIPDQTFELFLQEMADGHIDEAYHQAVIMIQHSGDEEFFRRLEIRVALNKQDPSGQLSFWKPSLIKPAEAERYCELLLRLSSNLSHFVVSDRAIRLVSRSSGLLLSYLILLPEETAVNMVERIIKKSSTIDLPLELMVDLHNIRRRSKDSEEMDQVRALFTDKPYQQIARVFIARIRAEAATKNKPWYDLYPFRTQHLIVIWKAAYGHTSLVESLNQAFDKDSKDLITFLHNISPIGTAGRTIKFLSLSKDIYKFIHENADTAHIYKLSKPLVASEPPLIGIDDGFVEPDPLERVQQFMLLHESYLKEQEKLEQDEARRQIRFEEEDDSDNETVDFDQY